MTERDGSGERAPRAIRLGLPTGAIITVLGLAVTAAFTGTRDWRLAVPIGLALGGAALAGAWLTLRRRRVSIVRWLDDYWTRDD